jgi:ribosome maturation factor RimP
LEIYSQMDLREKIEELALPYLSPIDAFIIDIQLVPGDRRKVVQLFIDTDTGITIAQCAEINRQLGSAIEVTNIIEDSFVLQVSSPGLEKPLKLLRQYQRNIGRKFKVRFQKEDQIAEVSGMLTAIDSELLTFKDTKNEMHHISFDKIIESIEELPW